MGSVQLLGFISILEREYNLDLSELKSRARDYFKAQKPVQDSVKEVKIFSASKKKRKLTIFYLFAAIAVVLTLLYFASRAPQSEGPEAKEEQHSMEIALQDENNDSALDGNLSQEGMMESTGVEEEIKVEPEVKPLSFKIIPKTKVWLGYIDLEDYKKRQTTFSDVLELNATKNWLLSFGHGHINIEINGETTEFKDPRTMRFSYIDSELKEIGFEEFKRLNRGSGW
ncbi:MAG TPA: hypothetical protein VIM82_04645, partial [Sulfurimonas sp.]